jgi:hypothetical protein
MFLGYQYAIVKDINQVQNGAVAQLGKRFNGIEEKK